ncbi:MAG: L28 family ribosomal protein [Candidatus Kerfeldbacteria bacterium]
MHSTMARACTICGRTPLNSNSRSHSNIATANRQHVNIQTLALNGKRVSACTSCIRRETKKLHEMTHPGRKEKRGSRR